MNGARRKVQGAMNRNPQAPLLGGAGGGFINTKPVMNQDDVKILTINI
jgi:hypothetical protein